MNKIVDCQTSLWTEIMWGLFKEYVTADSESPKYSLETCIIIIFSWDGVLLCHQAGVQWCNLSSATFTSQVQVILLLQFPE